MLKSKGKKKVSTIVQVKQRLKPIPSILIHDELLSRFPPFSPLHHPSMIKQSKESRPGP